MLAPCALQFLDRFSPLSCALKCGLKCALHASWQVRRMLALLPQAVARDQPGVLVPVRRHFQGAGREWDFAALAQQVCEDQCLACCPACMQLPRVSRPATLPLSSAPGPKFPTSLHAWLPVLPLPCSACLPLPCHAYFPLPTYLFMGAEESLPSSLPSPLLPAPISLPMRFSPPTTLILPCFPACSPLSRLGAALRCW